MNAILGHNLYGLQGREKAFKPIVTTLDLYLGKIILVTVENMHGVCQETESLHASWVVLYKSKEEVMKALIWAGAMGMQPRADRNDQGASWTQSKHSINVSCFCINKWET